MRNSIRTRLAITFVALAASLLLVVGAVLAWQSYITDQQRAVVLQSELALRISTQVVSYMQTQENALNELIRVRGFSNLDHDQQTQLLYELLAFTDAFDSLTLLSSEGKEQIVVSRSEIAGQLSDRFSVVEFTIPKYSGQIYYSSVRFSEKTGEPFFFISVPILDIRTGEVNNVLVANVRFKPVWDLLASISLGEGSNAYIVDAQNRVIAHNNPSVVLRNTLFTVPNQNGIHTGATGTNVVLAADRITLGDQKITIVTETPTSEAFAGIIRTELTIALLLLASITLAGGLGWLAARQIVEPIEDLAATAERVTSGDLSQKASIKRLDEIGALGNAFNAMTSQLRELIGSLERRVNERTAELEESTNQSEKRAAQLEAVAQVARNISTSQNLETLLPNITNVISQQFGFYHVGIFMLDADREFAVLRAANSPGGQKMLARNHQLKIGETGIVGFATGRGEARIALDTGADAVYFDNPDLPETRSEMALPLIISNQVIGALDVQSVEANAFSQDDVNTLSTLADQVSIAIQNSRLYEEIQEALAQSQTLVQQFTQAGWSDFTRTQKLTGIQRKKANATLLKEPLAADGLNGDNILDLPINLRGKKIGVLKVKAADEHQWTEDEIDIASAIIERAAIAMENVRLLNEAQRRAARERVIGDISASISTFSSMEGVLRTAVQQLGRRMGGAEVTIELGVDLEADETVSE